MAGLQDTLAGSETRRNGDTVGVPHAEADGTLLSNATVQPGDVVAIDTDTGELAQADSADATVDDVLGVLVNYDVYGASHQGEKIKGDVDANVAVQGTYKAKADGTAVAGGYVSAGTGPAGEFTSGSDFRVVDEYTDSDSQQWVEVVL